MKPKTYIANVMDDDGVLVTKVVAKYTYDALDKAITNLRTRANRLFKEEEVQLTEVTDEEEIP